MQNIAALSKGLTKLRTSFGMSTTVINNLTVNNFKIRTRKDSLLCMALDYHLRDKSFSIIKTEREGKPSKTNPFGGPVMITYAFSTVSGQEMTDLLKIFWTAKADVLDYQAKQLRDRIDYTSSPLPEWITYRWIDPNDDLPF